MSSMINFSFLPGSLWPRSLLLVLLLLISGCSPTNLLTKQDYQISQRNFVQGKVGDALVEFPRKAEENTFITTMEKSYLSLIQCKPQITQLQKQADLLEKRVRYHVSREASTFFYLQTPEDYYASEHEVIWLHFLLSWGYSLQGQYVDGCVEARVASSLLALPWSPTGHFDDPSMRLILASLWAMCGEWKEAQVDLRAAWFLDNSLTWAKELADHEQAPAHLFLVLGGPGPEPEWNPKLKANPLRSERQVSFKLRGHKSRLAISDRNGISVESHLSPDASAWYARHLARESELHEIILDSAYGRQAAASATLASVKIAASTGVGLAVGLGGTALGAAIIYAGGQSNSSDAVRAGLIVAAYSITKGIEITQRGYQESTSTLQKELDPSDRYRFVRYLPEYLWLGWSDQPITYPVQLRTPIAQIKIEQPTLPGRTSVTVAHMPDVWPPLPMNHRF